MKNQSINLFPSEPVVVMKAGKTPSVLEIIAGTPRKAADVVIDPNVKVSASRLKTVRNTLGDLFNTSGLGQEWLDSVRVMQLMDKDIASEKFGSYDAEFGRLHKAVQETFRLGGRPDLADQFSMSVPVYTGNLHPMDFVATLLKGASNPISVASQNNQYAVLTPFKSMMQDALVSKGIAAPSDMATLTQIFYNTFVAPSNDMGKLNFDTMTPSEQYHADDALVSAVVGYVKEMANKKKSGEQLSTIQDKIANIGIKVESGLTKAATNEVNNQVGGAVVKNSKTIAIVIGIVIVVIIYLVVKKG